MEEKLEKNKEYVVEIIDHGYEGEGIAKIGSVPIFIPNVLKGEVCLWKSLRIAKGIARPSGSRLQLQ